MRSLIPIFLMFLTTTSLASAQITDPAQLEDLAAQQKKAEEQAGILSQQQEKVKSEIGGLQSDLVIETAKSRGFEQAERDARQKLSQLERQERSLKSEIAGDKRKTTELLATLQRIERQPPPALLTSTQNATDTVRAAALAQYLTESLVQKTETLNAELIKLEATRSEMEQTRKQIATNSTEVETRLAGIKSVISEKSNLNSQLDKDRKRKIDEAAKLASEAQSLRDLIKSFEERADNIAPRIKPSRDADLRTGTPRPKVKPKRGQPAPIYIPSGGTRFADARGALPLPVLGRLATKFGAKLSGGGRSQGVSLTTAKRAQVVAPFDARIEFSGEFNDDNVVILNVGDGYFIVMTGLGETFASAGDAVISGEPLGMMPNLSKTSPQLFMEFRKDRSSIDPAPWIGTALAKG